MAHSWRVTKDISLGTDRRVSWGEVLENLDNSARLAKYAGPGGWNDLGRPYTCLACQLLEWWGSVCECTCVRLCAHVSCMHGCAGLLRPCGTFAAAKQGSKAAARLA